ncbi:MAG: hypothetical protein ACRESP_19435, partial [Pseudomonas sp.]
MFRNLDRPGTGRVLLTLLMLAAPSLALAQGPVLTLDNALQSAQANNPELAAARWGIDIAEGDRRQAGVLPNPE